MLVSSVWVFLVYEFLALGRHYIEFVCLIDKLISWQALIVIILNTKLERDVISSSGLLSENSLKLSKPEDLSYEVEGKVQRKIVVIWNITIFP